MIDSSIINDLIGADVRGTDVLVAFSMRRYRRETADLVHAFAQRGGKGGQHSEHLGYLLAELQYMQRAYPGLTW